MSRLACPICHNEGRHKMDCQNAAYVRNKDIQIDALKARIKQREIAQEILASLNELGDKQRIEQLEADLYEGNCELEKQQRLNAELEAYWKQLWPTTYVEKYEQLQALLGRWTDFYTDGLPDDEANDLYTDTLEVLG
jgi:hypothetical protein